MRCWFLSFPVLTFSLERMRRMNFSTNTGFIVHAWNWRTSKEGRSYHEHAGESGFCLIFYWLPSKTWMNAPIIFIFDFQHWWAPIIHFRQRAVLFQMPWMKRKVFPFGLSEQFRMGHQYLPACSMNFCQSENPTYLMRLRQTVQIWVSRHLLTIL